MNPCGKFSLINGAFYLSISDIVYTSLASIIIFLQILNLIINGIAVDNVYNIPVDETSIKRVLIVYMILNLVNFFLSVVLFLGITKDNIQKCYTYLLLAFISTIVGLSTVTYHGFHLLEQHMSLFNTDFFILLAYHIYKIYLLIVVAAFMREISNLNSCEDSENRHSRQMYESLESPIEEDDANADVAANVFFGVPFAAKHCILEENLSIDYDSCIEYEERTSTVLGRFQQSSTNNREVAVKILKCNYRVEKCMTDLVKEANLMLFVGNHQHIIQLLGICYTNSQEKGENVHLILENYPSNKLDDFLRGCFENRLVNFQDMLDRDFNKLKRQTMRLGTLYENLPLNYYNSEQFSTMTMAQWAYQLSSAMDYLHGKNIIIGNLQAKSLVLISITTVKLSDFSFASELREKNKEIHSTEIQGKVSWRWLALECLVSTNTGHSVVFNEKTDIWSYASTLYEIFSMGYPPRMSPNLLEYIGALKKGMIPEKPQFAPDGVYKLMKACWSRDPTERPNFKFISLFFNQLISTSVQKFY